MAAADGPEADVRQAIWLKVILVAKPNAVKTSGAPFILFIAVDSDSRSTCHRCVFGRNAQTRVTSPRDRPAFTAPRNRTPALQLDVSHCNNDTYGGDTEMMRFAEMTNKPFVSQICDGPWSDSTDRSTMQGLGARATTPDTRLRCATVRGSGPQATE